MRIDIYSDTVCPWCYLGKRRFELAMAARPQYEPRVTWRPFELNLDMPADGVDQRVLEQTGLTGRIEFFLHAAARGRTHNLPPARHINDRGNGLRQCRGRRRRHEQTCHAILHGLADT